MQNTHKYIKKSLNTYGVLPLGNWYSNDQIKKIESNLDVLPTSFSIGKGTSVKKIYDLEKLPYFLTEKIRIYEKLLQKKMDFLFYVSDNPGFENQNQTFHFDHIPKIKIIINLIGDNSGRTSYIPKSHKSFWPLINKFLRFFKISIAKNGCQHLPGIKSFLKKNSVHEDKFLGNQAVMFNTSIFHKAGNSNFKRRILILHFGS